MNDTISGPSHAAAPNSHDPDELKPNEQGNSRLNSDYLSTSLQQQDQQRSRPSRIHSDGNQTLENTRTNHSLDVPYVAARKAAELAASSVGSSSRKFSNEADVDMKPPPQKTTTTTTITPNLSSSTPSLNLHAQVPNINTNLPPSDSYITSSQAASPSSPAAMASRIAASGASGASTTTKMCASSSPTSTSNHHPYLNDIDSPNNSSSNDNSLTNRQSKCCYQCDKPLSKHFVRALGHMYHLDCFRCYDCNSVVVNKFFPLAISSLGSSDGLNTENDISSSSEKYPFCETDFFKRLDLICAKCNRALRGSYIIAVNKKYHVDHFTCSICDIPFGAKDSYYELSGNVYCFKHYSEKFALKCAGCKTSILRQYVEILKNSSKKHWHPECYMIYKFWSAKLMRDSFNKNPDDPEDELNNDDFPADQRPSEEKAAKIWSILSTFEESSATCISNFIVQLSNKSFYESILTCKLFINHIHAIFSAIDSLIEIKSNAPDSVKSKTGIQKLFATCERDARTLCRKTLSLFDVLADLEKSIINSNTGSITPEVLSLVTSLAHYLKMLIKDSLNAALYIDQKLKSDKAVLAYLNCLSHLQKGVRGVSNDGFEFDLHKYSSSDSCITCHLLIDEQCFVCSGNLRCHFKCALCCKCNMDLFVSYKEACMDPITKALYCSEHGSHFPSAHFSKISRLHQFTSLLNTALSRLYDLFKRNNTFEAQHQQLQQSPTAAVAAAHIAMASSDNPRVSKPTRKTVMSAQQELELLNQSDPKAIRLGASDLSKLAKPESLNSSTTQLKTDERILQSDELGIKRSESVLQNNHQKSGSNDRDRNLNLDDIPHLLREQEVQDRLNRPNAYQHIRMHSSKPTKSVKSTESLNQRKVEAPRNLYFSELTALESLTVKYLAVFLIHPIVKNKFSMQNLLELVETRKTSFWSQFGKAFKVNGQDKKNLPPKIFGVSLDTVLERFAVQSDQACSSGSVFVPSFIEDIIHAMRSKDLAVEGVFRKNGNIRRLRELSEDMDKDIKSVDFSKETSVQLAALMKKYLRSLPEPLLTYKLHPLWLASSGVEDDSARIRLVHLTCCLLPQTHRDLMEILFNFFYWVASFADTGGENGSKMDLHNLATVMAPNLLYKKRSEPGQEESFLAIEAVHTLFEYAKEFCEVPTDIAIMLQDPDILSLVSEPSKQPIHKRIEQAMQKRIANSDYNNKAPLSGGAAGEQRNQKEAVAFVRGQRRPPPPHMFNKTESQECMTTARAISESKYTDASNSNVFVTANSNVQNKKENPLVY